MQGDFEYIGLGFVSSYHLAVLPFIPVDTKVRMLSHAILGGGPAGNATAIVQKRLSVSRVTFGRLIARKRLERAKLRGWVIFSFLKILRPRLALLPCQRVR